MKVFFIHKTDQRDPNFFGSMCPNFLQKLGDLSKHRLSHCQASWPAEIFFTSRLFPFPTQHTVADCGGLSAPANGSVDLTNGTIFGSKVTYACNTADGYILVGNGERVCQANTSWSGSQPTCQKCDTGYTVVGNMCSKPEVLTKILCSWYWLASDQRSCSSELQWLLSFSTCDSHTNKTSIFAMIFKHVMTPKKCSHQNWIRFLQILLALMIAISLVYI